jgi:hypothetical protein
MAAPIDEISMTTIEMANQNPLAFRNCLFIVSVFLEGDAGRSALKQPGAISEPAVRIPRKWRAQMCGNSA